MNKLQFGWVAFDILGGFGRCLSEHFADGLLSSRMSQ